MKGSLGGDLQLFFQRHGGAGARLAVAQRGIKDDDAVGCVFSGGCWDGMSV